jgi:hypothetical protein
LSSKGKAFSASSNTPITSIVHCLAFSAGGKYGLRGQKASACTPICFPRKWPASVHQLYI